MASPREPDRNERDDDERDRGGDDDGITDGPPQKAGGPLDPGTKLGGVIQMRKWLALGTGTPRNPQSGPQPWLIS